MKIFMIIAIIIFVLALAATYCCFLIVFYSPNKKKRKPGEYEIPPGKIYKPYRETMVNWMKETEKMSHDDITIPSFDGLTLHGKYYEYAPGAPMELMFHGYRGNAERDLCGGVQRCFALGRNALIVDQRGSGRSGGHVITFGVKERWDCHSWIDYCVKRFGDDVKIILTGISMGAATVLMATNEPLPKNVVGVLADCGYTSAREIIQKCTRQLHLPSKLLYPLIKLSARLFGRFDLEETSPIEAMTHCTVPVIFIHGENDDFVPWEMSRLNYEACIAPKKLLTVPGAGHGLSFPADEGTYLQNVATFFKENGLPTAVLR